MDSTIEEMIAKMSVEELRAAIGPKGMSQLMAGLGRIGGSVKSERKAISSRLNGSKGGRPKKWSKLNDQG